MNKTKTLVMLAVGIALYVVLGMTVKIPLISHIQTDLGYIAFGVMLVMFGWQACIVGVIGCMFESLLVSGWIPVGWMVGQLVIGIICGIAYKRTDNKTLWIITTIVSVFIGVGLIKTLIECGLYGIPFAIKFMKNGIAVVADVIPMIIGLFVGERLNKVSGTIITKNQEKD